jgi:hypothetical protein
MRGEYYQNDRLKKKKISQERERERAPKTAAARCTIRGSMPQARVRERGLLKGEREREREREREGGVPVQMHRGGIIKGLFIVRD